MVPEKKTHGARNGARNGARKISADGLVTNVTIFQEIAIGAQKISGTNLIGARKVVVPEKISGAVWGTVWGTVWDIVWAPSRGSSFEVRGWRHQAG